MIVDRRLTDEITKSLNQYLLSTSHSEGEETQTYLGSRRIHEVVLDTCVWTDQSAANILKDIEKHPLINSLTISNCRFGTKSIK